VHHIDGNDPVAFYETPTHWTEATKQPVFRYPAAIQVTDPPRIVVKRFGCIREKPGSNIGSGTDRVTITVPLSINLLPLWLNLILSGRLFLCI
jgi:hypothetical protein